MRDAVLVTCEHGGNHVPREAAACFATAGARRALASHRGWDRGALVAARALAEAWNAPLIFSEVSRLVVELNRSPRHPRLLSEFTRDLDPVARDGLIERHWRPYRAAVESAVAGGIRAGARVVHLSIHSFTPVLRGERRNADLSFLYDPRRAGERALALAWQRALRAEQPDLRVRRNYPYRGTDDGFTTHLRRLHPAGRYVGVEVEFNRALFDRAAPDLPRAVASLAATLAVRA